MKIALIPGRFQPITIAHESIIRKAAEENDVVYVYIIGGGEGKQANDSKKNPIPVDKREELVNKTVIDSNVNVRTFPEANLDKIGDEIADEVLDLDNEIIIYAGTDRATYERQLRYINDPEKAGEKSKRFKARVEVIRRIGDDVSATDVRQALKMNDREAFETLTPDAIHDEFETLQGYVTESNFTIFDELMIEVTKSDIK